MLQFGYISAAAWEARIAARFPLRKRWLQPGCRSGDAGCNSVTARFLPGSAGCSPVRLGYSMGKFWLQPGYSLVTRVAARLHWLQPGYSLRSAGGNSVAARLQPGYCLGNAGCSPIAAWWRLFQPGCSGLQIGFSSVVARLPTDYSWPSLVAIRTARIPLYSIDYDSRLIERHCYNNKESLERQFCLGRESVRGSPNRTPSC